MKRSSGKSTPNRVRSVREGDLKKEQHMRPLVALLITVMGSSAPAHINNSTDAVPEQVQIIQEVAQPPITSEAPTSEQLDTVEPEPVVSSTNPYNCNLETQYIRADNAECINKPQPVVAVAHPQGCEHYRQLISQYDWRIETATAVMQAESSCNPQAVNNNPGTGDYSVGLFQINLYGANARTRPSEAELKDPATNIAWAYRLYSGNGKSFIGQWGVCRSKVSCY